MNIEPIGCFSSPLPEKFGVPRQPGLAKSLIGEVRLNAPFAREEALKGLEEFSHLWIIFGFHLNSQGPEEKKSLTVRPPRLGGNERVGVFASRSPFRPNPLGLSVVKIESVDAQNGIITVSGADLADGTPIYDIKPYVTYSDSIPDAVSGFVDKTSWQPLNVVFPEGWQPGLSEQELGQLSEILSLDPRPHYQNEPERIYGLTFAGRNIHFRVEGDTVYVQAISQL